MALISVNVGIAAAICFKDIDVTETEMYALADGVDYSTMKRYKVNKVTQGEDDIDIMECIVVMVKVSNSVSLYPLYESNNPLNISRNKKFVFV